jgi:DNA-binding transcriptional LysR family regulator
VQRGPRGVTLTPVGEALLPEARAPIGALVQRLREGSLDAGLSRAPLVDDLRTEELMREPVAERGTSPQNLLALVAAGIGVTRLPLSSRSLRDGGVVFVSLRDESIAIALVTNPAASRPALHSLRELLRSLTPDEVLG